jgi:hypothetical protein
VLQLSLLAKGLTRSTVVNVHGVSAKFIQAGEKKAALLRWQQQQLHLQTLEQQQQEQQHDGVLQQSKDEQKQQQPQQAMELIAACGQPVQSAFSKVSTQAAFTDCAFLQRCRVLPLEPGRSRRAPPTGTHALGFRV